MRGSQRSPLSDRGVVVGLVAAAVLGGTAALSATPAAAAPGQSPGNDGKARAAVCAKGADGRPVHCPGAVPPAKAPADARNLATVTQPVIDPAPLVDTRTWTTGGGNTFPGADVPFGMVQWSPDTMPGRSAGGGDSFRGPTTHRDSLTHTTGPGPRA